MISHQDEQWLRTNWTPHRSNFRAWVMGSDKAHQLVEQILKDLEEDKLVRAPCHCCGSCCDIECSCYTA